MDMMITPNITFMSMALAEQKTRDDVGIAVLSKALDNSQDNGTELVRMMEQSVAPYLGSNFDMIV